MLVVFKITGRLTEVRSCNKVDKVCCCNFCFPFGIAIWWNIGLMFVYLYVLVSVVTWSLQNAFTFCIYVY